MPLSPPCSALSQEWSHAEPCTRSASRGLTESRAQAGWRPRALLALGPPASVSHCCVTRDPEAPALHAMVCYALAQSVGREPTQATVRLSWKHLIGHAPWWLVLCQLAELGPGLKRPRQAPHVPQASCQHYLGPQGRVRKRIRSRRFLVTQPREPSAPFPAHSVGGGRDRGPPGSGKGTGPTAQPRHVRGTAGGRTPLLLD